MDQVFFKALRAKAKKISDLIEFIFQKVETEKTNKNNRYDLRNVPLTWLHFP